MATADCFSCITRLVFPRHEQGKTQRRVMATVKDLLAECSHIPTVF